MVPRHHVRTVIGIPHSESDSESSSSRTEDALLATRLKGRCFRCGTFGHKAADCPEKKTDDRKSTSNNPTSTSTKTPKTFKGDCTNYCGRKGHKEEYCFKKKQDSEAGNLGTESENYRSYAMWFLQRPRYLQDRFHVQIG